VVLGAAADDLYEMREYVAAIESAQRVIDTYPDAEAAVRRSAWIVIAHGSFELAEYPQAENAYAQVLTATPEDDESHAEFVDNLAASIYKQGELASDAQDYRAAAEVDLKLAAEDALRNALAPPRVKLLTQFNVLPEGVKFLADLRSDLVSVMADDPHLRGLERDLRGLLESWFDVGFLDLRAITWDSPASPSRGGAGRARERGCLLNRRRRRPTHPEPAS